MLTPDNSDLRLPIKKVGDVGSHPEDNKIKTPPLTRKNFKHVLEQNSGKAKTEKKKYHDKVEDDKDIDEDPIEEDDDVSSFIALISEEKNDKPKSLHVEKDLGEIHGKVKEENLKALDDHTNPTIKQDSPDRVKDSPYNVYKQMTSLNKEEKTAKDFAKKVIPEEHQPISKEDLNSPLSQEISKEAEEKVPVLEEPLIQSNRDIKDVSRESTPKTAIPTQSREPFHGAAMSQSETLSSIGLDRKESKDEHKGFTNRFQSEQTDISVINPMVMPVNVDATLKQGEGAPAVKAPVPIHELVAQIVKELYTVEKVGHTDTIIILQNPPLFKDAHLVVTSFDTANKELNLSFENLTSPAKKLLDDNLSALKILLEDKGYVTHILTTSTLVEHQVMSTETQTAWYEREGESKGGGQEGGEEDKDNRKKQK